jgi:RHS repeat-associated protein
LEAYGYDPATGWLDHQQVGRGGTALLDLIYKYGTAGRKTGQLMAIKNNLVEGFAPAGVVGLPPELLPPGGSTWIYNYDALGRLKRLASLSFPGGRPEEDTIATIGEEQWSQSYSYDRFGNRTGVALTQKVPSLTVLPWSPLPRDGLPVLSYDPGTNRITTAGFEYDAAGNLTRSPRADGTWQRLQYDAAGRLARVLEDVEVFGGTHFPVSPVVSVETYTYGADRRRLVAERGTFEPTVVEGGTHISVAHPPVPRPHERTYYAWDRNAVIAEYTEAEASSWEPKWSRSYVYLRERLLATLTPGSNEILVQYSHPGRSGTRLVTAEADDTVAHRITLPYGTVLDADTMGTAGRIFESYDRGSFTGLDYAVNRYYEPRLGRFTQVEPLGMQVTDVSDPQRLNLYNYVGNDPINRTESLGTDEGTKASWLGIALGGGAVVLTAVGMVVTVPLTGPVLIFVFGSSAIGGAVAGWGLGKAEIASQSTDTPPTYYIFEVSSPTIEASPPNSSPSGETEGTEVTDSWGIDLTGADPGGGGGNLGVDDVPVKRD